MRTYSAYFSTISNLNSPTLGSNGANDATWPVNWRKIFGNRVGECRVRANLISQSNRFLSESPYENGNASPAFTVGSVYVNFMSNTSDTTNGFGVNLGSVRPVADPTEILLDGIPYCNLELDTRQTNGSSVVIPDINNQAGIIRVRFMDGTDTPMDRVPAYQLWLYFDIDDEIPIQHNVEKCPVSYF